MNERDRIFNDLLSDLENIVRKNGAWHKRNAVEIKAICETARELELRHGFKAGNDYFQVEMATLREMDPDHGISK